MSLISTATGTASTSRFPCLRVMRGSGVTSSRCIVLFTGETQGTVVHTGNQDNLELGYFDNQWSPEAFDDFQGEVVISAGG